MAGRRRPVSLLADDDDEATPGDNAAERAAELRAQAMFGRAALGAGWTGREALSAPSMEAVPRWGEQLMQDGGASGYGGFTSSSLESSAQVLRTPAVSKKKGKVSLLASDSSTDSPPPEPWAPAAQHQRPQPHQAASLTVSVPRASLAWDERQKATLGLYEIHCEARASLRAGTSSWLVARRYSSFVMLREHLEQAYPSAMVQQLPPFPPKYWWGNTDPKVLEERRVMFDKYLSAVMITLEDVDNDEVVRRFLCKGRVPVSAEGCTYQEAVAAASAAKATTGARDDTAAANEEGLAKEQQHHDDAASGVQSGDDKVGEESTVVGDSLGLGPVSVGVASDSDETTAARGVQEDEEADEDFAAATLSLEEIMRLRGFDSPDSRIAQEEQQARPVTHNRQRNQLPVLPIDPQDVARLAEMGYTVSDCETALQQARGDLRVAATLLVSAVSGLGAGPETNAQTEHEQEPQEVEMSNKEQKAKADSEKTKKAAEEEMTKKKAAAEAAEEEKRNQLAEERKKAAAEAAAPNGQISSAELHLDPESEREPQPSGKGATKEVGTVRLPEFFLETQDTVEAEMAHAKAEAVGDESNVAAIACPASVEDDRTESDFAAEQTEKERSNATAADAEKMRSTAAAEQHSADAAETAEEPRRSAAAAEDPMVESAAQLQSELEPTAEHYREPESALLPESMPGTERVRDLEQDTEMQPHNAEPQHELDLEPDDVARLVEMGYAIRDCETALRQARGDMRVAAILLVDNIGDAAPQSGLNTQSAGAAHEEEQVRHAASERSKKKQERAQRQREKQRHRERQKERPATSVPVTIVDDRAEAKAAAAAAAAQARADAEIAKAKAKAAKAQAEAKQAQNEMARMRLELEQQRQAIKEKEEALAAQKAAAEEAEATEPTRGKREENKESIWVKHHDTKRDRPYFCRMAADGQVLETVWNLPPGAVSRPATPPLQISTSEEEEEEEQEEEEMGGDGKGDGNCHEQKRGEQKVNTEVADDLFQDELFGDSENFEYDPRFGAGSYGTGDAPRPKGVRPLSPLFPPEPDPEPDPEPEPEPEPQPEPEPKREQELQIDPDDVAELVEMGYTARDCELALRQARGDMGAAARLLVAACASSASRGSPTSDKPPAATMSPEDLQGDWIGERDAEGRLYYWNTSTRKVVWEADAPPIVARTAERLAKMHAQKAKEKAHQDGRRAVEGDIASTIKSWHEQLRLRTRTRTGKIGIVPQLMTLSQVWPAAAATLDSQTTAVALNSDAAVKKAYFKAVRLVHPDKLNPDASAEDTVKAAILFEGLREAWESYTPGDWTQAVTFANESRAVPAYSTASATPPPPPRGGGSTSASSSSSNRPSAWQAPAAGGRSNASTTSSSASGSHSQTAAAGGPLGHAKKRKAEGNELFAAGSYALAAGRYKAALDALHAGHGPPPRHEVELVAMWAQLNLNIALCRVRTGELKSAERDASRVIDAGATAGVSVTELGKAHYRRATVRITQANGFRQDLQGDQESSTNGAVKLMQSARQDLSAARQLIPSDETIQAALLECEATLRQMSARRKKDKGTDKRENKKDRSGRRQAGEY